MALVKKSKADWKALLPANRYAVLFEGRGEPPFGSPLNAEKRHGIFVCAACHLPLFDSAHKFDASTGWPSFWAARPGAVAMRTDYAQLTTRVEYHCARCGGHQGHLFEDGPEPSRKRYSNNGLALKFVAAGEPLPPLRN